MNLSLMRNIGAFLKTVFLAINKTATAGGTGDATEVDGAWIDRLGFESMVAAIPFTATLAAGKTLSIAANLQDADAIAGTGAADYGTAYGSTVAATGGAGGSTETGCVQLNFDLSKARRYVRLQYTPDLSASGTDTCETAAIAVLGGPTDTPAVAVATAPNL